MLATESTRVRRGFLQYELEHKRIGANVWERVWCEAGRGELVLWRGVDVRQDGITPTTDPLRKLDLDAAKVGLTKNQRKEEAHSFRITLTQLCGGAVETKHVLAASSAAAQQEWMGTVQANINLCSLPDEERQALIGQDEQAADAEELQEQLSGIVQLCAGVCATACSLARSCCESCLASQNSQSNGGASGKYCAVAHGGTKASDNACSDIDGSKEVSGTRGETPLAVYICKRKQCIRETTDKSSRIVGWVEEGTLVEVFEVQAASAGTGHTHLRLADGWVNSGGGPIVDSKPMVVYFEKEEASVFSAFTRRTGP